MLLTMVHLCEVAKLVSFIVNRQSSVIDVITESFHFKGSSRPTNLFYIDLYSDRRGLVSSVNRNRE